MKYSPTPFILAALTLAVLVIAVACKTPGMLL